MIIGQFCEKKKKRGILKHIKQYLKEIFTAVFWFLTFSIIW